MSGQRASAKSYTDTVQWNVKFQITETSWITRTSNTPSKQKPGLPAVLSARVTATRHPWIMDLFPTSMAKCPLNLTSLHRRDAAMCLTLTPGLLAANHLQQHHPKGINIYCSTIFLLSTRKFRCYGICPSYICKWLGVCKHAHIDNDCQPSDIIDFWCNEINGTNNRSVTHSWQHESKSPTVSQRFFKRFLKMWGIWVDSPPICSVPLLLHIVFQGCSYQLSNSCAWHTMPWG